MVFVYGDITFEQCYNILMDEIESKFSPSSDESQRETKYSPNPYLRTLRQGIENKDVATLRMITNAIQRQVHRLPQVAIAPMTDYGLQELIDKGTGMIIVGTGTLGERIFIEDGELFMPEEKDQPGSKQFYDNFRYVFDLGDDQELRVKF